MDGDEEQEAQHAGKRVAILELARMVKSGDMDASEARRILAEDVGVEAEDESDDDAISNLAALANDPKRHRELSPDLRDAAAEDKAVGSYIKRQYGGASDEAVPDETSADDEDKAVAAMMKRMRKRGGAPVGVRGDISTIDQSK